MKWLCLLGSFCVFFGLLGCRAEVSKVTPKTTAELEQEIRMVLKKTNTPAIGAAIVSRDKVLWLAGVGKADVAKNIDATPDTLFRIGSISKSFVSLSVLKLQEQGKLSLNDTVRSLAPEIQFQNPWESTDPVRVVNLLEHTTGFDDITLREYALNDPKPLTLREGLDYYPRSRNSRWRPGTRFAYCNAGPAIAAYIVEKVTGQRFEDYVKENFFRPLHMNTADYFLTPAVQQKIATLYHPDGKTSYRYWHIIMRPSGAINASAREMANYVQFYLNRGSFGGVALVRPASIDRMEMPSSTLAAREGLRTGYGLSNYSQTDPDTGNGFVFHGHDGGVAGGLAAMHYLPDQDLGYVFMINAGNAEAFKNISKLIRNYVTRDLKKPPLPQPVSLPLERIKSYLGYVEPVSPRVEFGYFLERLLGNAKVTLADNKLVINPILGKRKEFLPVSDRLFRVKDEPVATLALVQSHEEGTLLQTGFNTFRLVPGWVVWLQWGLGCTALALMSSSVFFALLWVPRKVFGKLRDAPHVSVRLLPLVSVLCFMMAILLVVVSRDTLIERFGDLTIWSVGFFLLTIAFAVFAIWGLVQAIRARRWELHRGVYFHSLAIALACAIVAVYLTYWGMVGFRSWA